jgi:hypothetical protein
MIGRTALALVVLLLGCASPPTAAPPIAAPSAGPVFAPSGPDAEDYGASKGYPRGDRSTFYTIPMLVGAFSHMDEVFEGRRIGRAATPSRFARAPVEPTIRWQFQGLDLTVDGLSRAESGHGAPRRARRDDLHRALPVRAHRPRSLHVLVHGEDRDLDAGRDRDRRRPHPLGR